MNSQGEPPYLQSRTVHEAVCLDSKRNKKYHPSYWKIVERKNHAYASTPHASIRQSDLLSILLRAARVDSAKENRSHLLTLDAWPSAHARATLIVFVICIIATLHVELIRIEGLDRINGGERMHFDILVRLFQRALQ